MKRANLFLVIILLLITNLYAQKPLRKISLQLSWLHQFQFAGYYIAKEKGYFKEYGLDVQIKQMNNDVNLVNDVIDGKSTFAVGRSSIIIDKLNGKDIVTLSAIFQHSPLMLLSLKESNINNVDDLRNKRIMLTTDAQNTVAIHAMTASKGLSDKDIIFQPHSFNLDDLIDKKTDAMGCYVSNEPYILNSKNIPYNILHPRDYGFDFYDGLLFTSRKELQQNPIDVNNFNDAVLRGWDYAFSNIGETINIIYNKYNTQNKTLDALIYEAYTLKDLAEFDQGNLGKINQEKVEEIAKIYSLLGFIKSGKFDLGNFIYDSNLVIYSKSENEYIANNSIITIKEEFPPFFMKPNGIADDVWNLLLTKVLLSSEVKSIKNSELAREKVHEDRNTIKLVLNEKDHENKKVIFSQPIKTYKYAIVTRNDESFIFNTNLLSGKPVAIRKDATINSLIKLQYPNINFIEVDNIKVGLELVANGEAYAAIELLPTIIYNIQQNMLSNIKISGTTEYTFDLRYMINQENTVLKNIIDKAISKINKKELQAIEDTYFQVRYDEATDHSLIYKVGVPLLFFVLIFAFYNIRLRKEIQKRKIIEQKLYNAATTDKLTQAYNRRKIDSTFKGKIELSERYGRPLSIIFYDIDNFKKINDVYGHSLADTVLQDLTKLVQLHIRSTDYLGRWGGEEFLILLPETNLEQSSVIAEHLKKHIERYPFKIGQQVTCSFGVTDYKEDDTQESMLSRVDELMYYVKRHGKNAIKAE